MSRFGEAWTRRENRLLLEEVETNGRASREWCKTNLPDRTFGAIQARVARVIRPELAKTPDPRTAHLAPRLRRLAEEFLTLHDAWDTNFVASGSNTIYLDWPDGDGVEANANHSKNGGWKLCFRAPASETYFSFQSKNLDRSADFAEFLRQFGGVR